MNMLFQPKHIRPTNKKNKHSFNLKLDKRLDSSLFLSIIECFFIIQDTCFIFKSHKHFEQSHLSIYI